jgi:hypothetical protein
LDVCGSLEEVAGFVVLVVLDVVEAELGDGVEVLWHVLIAEGEIVQGLLIIIFSLPKPSYF